MDSLTLGQWVLARRKQCGWSLQDLADHSGESKGNLSRIERGLGDVQLSTLVNVAQAFGLGAGDMLHLAGLTTPDAAYEAKRTLVTYLNRRVMQGEAIDYAYVAQQTNALIEQLDLLGDQLHTTQGRLAEAEGALAAIRQIMEAIP